MFEASLNIADGLTLLAEEVIDFSHPVNFLLPEDIQLGDFGSDEELVEVAAKISKRIDSEHIHQLSSFRFG